MSKTMTGICGNCGESGLLYMWNELLVCWMCRDRKGGNEEKPVKVEV